jgi:ABC-type glycerol-3-phosphate transport system substrate-binding protein
MKTSRKIAVLLSALLTFALLLAACGGNSSSNEPGQSAAAASSGTPAETQQPADPQTPVEKISLTVMIASVDDKVASEEEKMLTEHFADKYDIKSKQWDTANAEKNIKTTIAAGNPIDLAMYYPSAMSTFVDANMALDLTPYLDANNGEWKNSFLDGVLDAGNYNGKVYAVPYASVYPLLEVNKDILEKAGVTIPDGPFSWDDFMKACAAIKEKAGIWPIGIYKDWAGWVPINNLINVWSDKAKADEFNSGGIPFTDPSVVAAFDASKELYDKYVYPGKGALTATLEQVSVAFKAGKIAMKADVNILASKSVMDSGLKNVQIVSWPHMGTTNLVLGGSNGYMIPANVAHPDASAELMKYLTSPEVLQKRVDSGAPVTVKGVSSSDPNFALYSKDTSNIQATLIQTISPEMTSTFQTKQPSDYIFRGKAALDDLEKLRLAAISKK